METVPSIMAFHLRYRLWIAELNFDIDILRIFDDYLYKLANKENEPEVRSGVAYFKKQFTIARKEIDQLRHNMHLLKMELAAYSREGKNLAPDDLEGNDHSTLKKHHARFRRNFNKLKMTFSDFESKWL